MGTSRRMRSEMFTNSKETDAMHMQGTNDQGHTGWRRNGKIISSKEKLEYQGKCHMEYTCKAQRVKAILE
eukprot:11052062-Karenia_brevis.AAC.1